MSTAVGRSVVAPARLAQLVQHLRGLYGMGEAAEHEVGSWGEVLRDCDALDVEEAWGLVSESPPASLPSPFGMRERILAITRQRVAESATRSRFGEPTALHPDRGRLTAVWPLVAKAIMGGRLPVEHKLVLAMPDDDLAAAIGMEPDAFRERIGRPRVVEPVEARACHMCDDTRFLEAPDGSVSPCPQCRPEQDRLWRAGHYRANHSCPECTGTERSR